jgi:deoxyribonuclease-4
MDYTRCYRIDWILGAHTAFSGKICDTLWTSINYGMTATQFFMGNPKGFTRAKITEQDINECKKILKRWPLHVITHFPYIANLAGSKDVLAWNGDSAQDTKTQVVLNQLEYELAILSNFPNNGVVIHPGNYTDRKVGLQTIAKSINKINFVPGSKLILENSAGQGTSLATTLEEIACIIYHTDPKKRKHIGVCIDTCHLYAVGDYDLAQSKEVTRLFEDFDRIIGMEYFTALHLNDSEDVIKSRKDRHACIGTGNIWKDNFDSLILLLDMCKQYNIPAILETHGIDMITIACIEKNKMKFNLNK